MDTNTYDAFWAVFHEASVPILQAARDQLKTTFGIATTEIEQTDHDDERGLTFQAELLGKPLGDHNAIFAELLLADGDVRGFPSSPDGSSAPEVSVMLTVSDMMGREYTSFVPRNYSTYVGVSDPILLADRIRSEFPAEAMAVAVASAWEQASKAAVRAQLPDHATVAASPGAFQSADR